MGDNELMVTIPLEDYKDLIANQRSFDELIDYIFDNSIYNHITNDLEFDEYRLRYYLHSNYGYRYNKTIEEKQKNSIVKS